MPHPATDQIPDKTQAYVDRLLGTRLGRYEVVSRLGETARATIYKGVSNTDEPVTLEILRAGVTVSEADAKQARLIRSPGIAQVIDYGQLPDGRQYRVLEPMNGEPFEALLQRGERLPRHDVLRMLREVADALQAAHAWTIAHGNLSSSSVFMVERPGATPAIKLLDFGLESTKRTTQADLRLVGALGFALLSGRDLGENAPPPEAGAAPPEPLDALLLDLIGERVTVLEELRKHLARLDSQPAPAPAAASKPRRAIAIAVAGLVLIGLASGGAFMALNAEGEPPLVVPLPNEEDEAQDFDDLLPDDELPEPANTPGVSPTHKHTPKGPRVPKAVPTAEVLYDQIGRLESQYRQHARPGDDIQAALFTLNKQRLRLSGSPTVEDRKDVAQQLAGWRRNYLRR